MTSGVTETDGSAQPEFRIKRLEGMLENYEARFSRRNGHG
jgi:hypothetical protein